MINNVLVITGGMGTGKSTVLDLFEKNGFMVLNSDKEVSFLFTEEYEHYHTLAKKFDNWLGTDFSHKKLIDKKILRPYLENRSDGFSKSLELVKPYITDHLIKVAEENKGKKIVFEIPLLFEAHMESYYKNILLITSTMDIRIERIKLRQPHLSIEQIKQTIDSQIPQEEKINKSTFIIDNSGSLSDLENKFNSLLPEFSTIFKHKKNIIQN